MKKLRVLSVLLALIFCMSVLPASVPAAPAFETRGTVAEGDFYGLHWKLTSSGKLTITGSGIMKSLSDTTKYPWIKYRDKTVSLKIGNGITTIAGNAFYDFAALESVDLPETLVEIRYQAFYNCKALKSVEVPDGVNRIGSCAFRYCSALETVKLPREAIEIGYGAFEGCSSLKEVVIPNGVKYLQPDVFMACEALETIYIPASVTEINGDSFWHCYALKNVYYPASKAKWDEIVIDSDGTYYLRKAKLNVYSCYLPHCSFTLRYTKYAYTGEPITPWVTVVTPSGTTLKRDKNFTVSYENNTEMGTAMITVTGIGKYNGTATLKFRITPGMPKNVRQKSYTDTTATIAWDNNPNADKYYVYVGLYGEANDLPMFVGETTAASYKIKNLSAGYSMEYFVRSVAVITKPDGTTKEILSPMSAVTVTIPE